MRLPEEAGSHIARVLRMKCDQKVILFNGQGGEYLAVIIEVQRNRVTVKIESYNDKDIESSLKITLVQCISRGERMDHPSRSGKRCLARSGVLGGGRTDRARGIARSCSRRWCRKNE